MEDPTKDDIPLQPLSNKNKSIDNKQFLDNFRRVPEFVIYENKNIVKFRSKRIITPEGNVVIPLDNAIQTMQQSVFIFGGDDENTFNGAWAAFLEKYSHIPGEFPTPKYLVLNQDCLEVAFDLLAETGQVPLLLDLAERAIHKVCGKWHNSWVGAQEEYIERRSGVLRLGLDPTLNPHLEALLRERNGGQLPQHHIPEFASVYLQAVPITRNNQWQVIAGHHVMDVVACGAVDLRYTQNERGNYYTKTGKIKLEKFISHTKMKVRSIYMCAVETGHKHLVLGAIGCGVYRNDPNIVSQCFREVLEEDIFLYRFEKVVFAVLGDTNFKPFKEGVLNDCSGSL